MRVNVIKKRQDKQELIDKLSAQNITLMFFYDEDPEDKLSYEKVGEDIYLIHPPYYYKTLKNWLYLGNWQAVVPSNTQYKPFDTFRTKEKEIEKQMDAFGISLIIDSFHDNIEWKVIEKT